jgi:hypothetical protein
MPISTKFNKVPYTIAGDSFISSAKDLSTQYTKNMIAVPAPNSLTDSAALYSFPGQKAFSTGVSGEFDRGIHKQLFQGKGWKVSGATLYSFTSEGVQTSEATIGGGGLVSMVDNGNVLLIVASGTAYTYDGTTLEALSLTFAPVQAQYLNSKFLLLSSDNTVYVSNVGVAVFDPINSYQAESSPDDLIAIKVFNQFCFNMGSRTIEPWEDIGSGNPPLARMNGAIIEDAGIANKDCVCATSDALYFLGFNKIPYRVVNFQAQKLTDNNPGIVELFESYNKSSAFVECFTVFGQDVILFYFPTDKKVWCFSQETNLWFEVDHGVVGTLYQGKTIARLFDKNLIGDKDNGNIYELDADTYQNNGTPIVRERVFRPMAGETIGSPRAYLQMRLIQFAVESGVGVNDDNPQMMVSFSTDGGRTFSNERWLSLGENGDYQELIETYSNRKFKDLTVKIRYVDNTRFSLYDAAIYLRESGK